MPIQSIQIKNFQAHKSLKIDFGESITCITGASDRGKSAILRALVWVITNRPNGDSFIRYGADECAVAVSVDGHNVQRIKGKKQNSYIVDGVEFKALKTDVPQEVQSIFNITENNIQQQFDPIFWFSLTAGEVGRNLNKIVNLDIIDYTMATIQNESKTVKTNLDFIQEMIAEQESKLENSDKIDMLMGLINRINGFQKELDSLNNEIETLNAMLQQLNGLERAILAGEKSAIVGQRFELLANEYTSTLESCGDLQAAIRAIKEVEKTINSFNISEEFFDKINEIEEKQRQLDDCRKNWKQLHTILTDIEDADQQIDILEKQFQEADRKFHETIKDNVCPLCGRGKK